MMRSSNRFSSLSENNEMAFRSTTTESGEWTRVGGPKKAPHASSRHYTPAAHGGAGRANYAGHTANGGAGNERARSSIEQETKRRLYAVHDQMKRILQTSGGDISLIGSKSMDYYRTLSKPEEKAKLIGVLVENSLHELFCPGTFFGNIIASEMSITSSLSGLKERDGYNLFTWAVWIPWNKEPIAGLKREEDDIISSVSALMAHRVNPFRINQKHETFFDTAELCVSKKKFSAETYDAIYQMMMHNPVDIDLYMSSLKHFVPDILNPEMKFSKGYLQWCLISNEELSNALIAEVFEMDKYRVGETKVSFQTTDFQYVIAFDALMKLVRAPPHKNFEQYFHENPINVDALTNKIASYYMDNILKLLPTAYQLVDSPKEDGWLFKNLENLGAYIWDVSRYTELPDGVYNDFLTKVKVGYCVRGLKQEGANADKLRDLLTGTLSPVERSFVTRAMESASIALSAPAKAVSVVAVVEEAPKIIEGFKTGLELLSPEEVVIYNATSDRYHSPGCIHDTICDITDMSKTKDSQVIARSFVIAAGALYKAHQLAKLGAHLKFLLSINLLQAETVKKVLEEEEENILEINDYSKSSKEVIKILRTSLE
jgi:hypothetical protein